MDFVTIIEIVSLLFTACCAGVIMVKVDQICRKLASKN
jgi:hypothetical protein